jgi:hypothetical protein
MNEMLAQPTNISAMSSIGRLGASAANDMVTPKPLAATTSGRTPIFPRKATSRPPSTAPNPIAAVMNPKPAAPTWSPRLAITGRDTWNS